MKDVREEMIERLMLRNSMFQTELIRATEYNKEKCLMIVVLNNKIQHFQRQIDNKVEINETEHNTKEISIDVRE